MVMEELTRQERVQRALEYIRRDDERTLREQLEMCQIPAPSYMEREKARYVLGKFREIGLEDVYMDDIYNVFGTIRGSGEGPRLMLAAHTDTVFPAGTDVTVKREGSRYICPGINDDTRAVAEILTIARAMKSADLRGEGDIVFCANVCEEGLGDLKGVKQIFGGAKRFDGFVTIDNPVTGGIIYTATGSRRYRVEFEGRGGHSFADFGLPNPIHAMGRAIAKIAGFRVPKHPKTTFNVGVVEGGTSVNTIPARASLLADIRSDSREELERLSTELERAVDEAVSEENSRWESLDAVSARIKLVGMRPAGSQSPDSKIVKAAWNAALALGIEPELRDESSTDANIPISMGIPAIAVGRGGNEGQVHTVQEWFEPADSYLGPQKDLLLILALSGYREYREFQLDKRI